MHKARRPTFKDVHEFKNRYDLTYAMISSRMYGTTAHTVSKWFSRDKGNMEYSKLPLLAWWALVLEFEGIDLRDIDVEFDCT